MDEIVKLISSKIAKYKDLYIIADQDDKDGEVKYYAKCIDRLSNALEELTKN